MSSDAYLRKLTAIFYADVAGYSRLTGSDEAGTHTSVMAVMDYVAETVKLHGGNVLRYAGDAILAEFLGPTASIEAAIAIQNYLGNQNAEFPDEKKVQIRVGINVGEVIEDRGEIFGDGVNIAARLESSTNPGGISISSTVFDQIDGKFQTLFKDAGEQTFKNISRPVHVYDWSFSLGDRDHNKSNEQALVRSKRPTIAVLAFDNFGEESYEYLADGISEDLITGLSKIRWFTVFARNSTFTYKGRAVDVTQVSKELGARYVLEGSVRVAGTRVRVTAQLVDAHNGQHIWADRYDREIVDIFDLQDEMTQTIVGAVEPELSAVEREYARHKPPESLDAWECYQQGVWHMWLYTNDSNRKALDLLQQARYLDPTFGPAYSYGTYSHYQRLIMGWTDDEDEDLRIAFELARRAIEIDEKDPVAYFAIGRVYMMQGQHDASERSLRTSIKLNPSFAQAYHGLGMTLVLAGELEEAKRALLESERLSPQYPIGWASLAVYCLAEVLDGNFVSAEEWARRTIEMPRSSGYWAHAVLAASFAHQERFDEARSALEHAREELPALSIEYLKRTLKTKNPDGLELYLDGLRQAGLA